MMDRMRPTATLDPRPIVVGVERSERSRDALALAEVLADAAGARLILVAVYAEARSLLGEPDAPAEEAQSTLEWVARSDPGVRAEWRAVPSTSVSRGLQRVAAAESALAIVVGASQRGAIGWILPGSVGTRLLHEAPCPVAVAPRGYADAGHAPIREIGVGYAATPEAGEALSAAIGLAGHAHAAVRALSVVELSVAAAPMAFGLGVAEYEEAARQDLSAGVRQAIDRAGIAVEISSEVTDGYADDELARLSGDVDLLVCGSRGFGTIGSVMLGSVSTGLLRKARGPVLIIPRGADNGFATLHARAVGAGDLALFDSNPQPGRTS
jgi:nucleotide-binding universal stress UspA family protein